MISKQLYSSRYKFTYKQRDASLFVYMFVCFPAVYCSLVKIKIQTESRLHCIDKYADELSQPAGNSACELFEINTAQPTQHLEPEIR